LFAINYNSNGNFGKPEALPDYDDNHIMIGGWDDDILEKDENKNSIIDWVNVIPDQPYWSL